MGNVIITGANRGIGKALLLKYAYGHAAEEKIKNLKS